MAARLWTALLLLAAVFAMHGAQCTAADGPAHASTPAATAVGMSELGPASLHPAAAPLSTLADPMGAAHPPDVGHIGPPDIAVAVAPAPAGHGGAPHDGAGHLWTVCLAVLAAGLAVLLAVPTRRLAHPTWPVPARVRARLGSPAPRPPDLSALCLLRI